MQKQEKNGVTRRLDMLDGLRGFAIILVFLNHIDSHFIADAVPSFVRPTIYFLFSSGRLGVTFFFILSGFLMGYLYKNPNPKEFIERRYARIFPPFLVMVTCMWIFRIFPSASLFERIVLMLSVAFLVRYIWVHIVERFHKGSVFVTLFIVLQLIIAVWYGFFIMRRPSLWFDTLPFLLKEGTIFASNATLTLPLGNYIPQLDGVYWSLASEMIFYLLYPFLFAPTVRMLQKKTTMFVVLFATILFPLFFGLSLLFKHSQGLAMLCIEYFIFFCGGIGIAHIVSNHEKRVSSPMITYLVTPILFFILLFLSYFFLSNSTGLINTCLWLLLIFPFGYIVYSLIEEDTPLRHLFQHKIFLFLGTISYSMYISHTAVVDGMHLIFRPSNALTNILFLLATALVFLLVSSALHNIIEKPYFLFKPSKKLIGCSGIGRNNAAYGILFVIILFLFFSTYTSQFNFFSTQKKYTNIIPSSIFVSNTPYTFFFTAQENNMGVILVHLTNVSETKAANPTKHQRFQIRMREKNAHEWYASQDTSPAEIGNSSSYSFGFPPIVDSKNKTYVVEMSIKDFDYSSTVLFNKDKYELITIHQIPKQSLLKNPVNLVAHVSDKLQTAFSNPEAQLVALCISPFFILIFFLLYT
ncbi:MAG: acyltransferase [bacterium]